MKRVSSPPRSPGPMASQRNAFASCLNAHGASSCPRRLCPYSSPAATTGVPSDRNSVASIRRSISAVSPGVGGSGGSFFSGARPDVTLAPGSRVPTP